MLTEDIDLFMLADEAYTLNKPQENGNELSTRRTPTENNLSTRQLWSQTVIMLYKALTKLFSC